MMRKIIRYGWLIVFSVTCLASCGSDDNDDNNSVTRPVITVNGKYLTRINSSELEYNAQGQLVKVKSKDATSSSADFGYSYEAKRIIMTPYDMIYYLDGGRISECRYTMLTSLDENALPVDVKETYEYDRNGYMVKETRPGYDFTEDAEPVITIIYEWQDGNIQRITRTESPGDYAEETTFSYTSYANNIPDVSQGLIGNYLGWQGYFGKRCKNLPASETATTYSNGHLVESITYDYDYAFEDGVVTRVTAKWNYKGTPSIKVSELVWY